MYIRYVIHTSFEGVCRQLTSVILTQARWGGDFPDPNHAKRGQTKPKEIEFRQSYYVKKVFLSKQNRWEPIVSAMSKKKWHTYYVFGTPNRWEPIVVTGHFAFLHTL